MMRYLGIDYGTRRIGLATADEETGIATPRGAVLRESDTQAIAEIKAMVVRESAGEIVVGLALAHDGTETDASRAARIFGGKLGVACGVPVEFENEMLTSRMAEDAGMRGGDIDASSAAIILQSYLDKRRV